jgi:cytochrome c2
MRITVNDRSPRVDASPGAKNMVPGSRMEYPGIADPNDLQALIDDLSTTKSR